MNRKKKQILFATGTPGVLTLGAGLLDDKPDVTAVNVGGGVLNGPSLAEILSRRVNAWAEKGQIEPTQLTLFLRRVKEEPAVTDVKLDGNVLVLTIDNGTEERIFPDAGIELPEVPAVGHYYWYEKCWHWVKNHKAVAIGGGSLLVLLIVLLIVKHR